jgi:cyclohexanone monooxygenase
MTWDEENVHWVVRTHRNDTIRARYVVTSTGNLHKPKLPGIPGIISFKGHYFHTSRWDYDYTGGYQTGELSGLRDKRVAIIGTGATSIQIVPMVAKYAKEFYVFQRTPSSGGVRNNRTTDANFAASLKSGWQLERMRNFNAVLAGAPVEEDLVDDGWTDMKAMRLLGTEGKDIGPSQLLKFMELADYKKMEGIRARVDEIVRDKDTAEKLKPWYPSMCKRPCKYN